MAIRKCPKCGFPLELAFKSQTELRYRCSTCGRQESEQIDEKASFSEEMEANQPESTN